MGEHTNISWCDATLNFWIGCTEVSPACDFCYARTWGHRFGVEWGVGAERRITVNWLEKARAIERRAAELGRPPLVFSNSLSDIFDKEVPIDLLAAAFDVMRATPGNIYLLLTKRIGIAAERAAAAGGFPRNAAIGATFCNQPEWDRDGHKLREARDAMGALFAFASFEPALGPIRRNGGWWPDWAIWGGESGVHARPAHPDWARGVRDDSAEAGSAFQLKQWGEWAACRSNDGEWPTNSGNFIRLCHDGQLRGDGWPMQKVGKKAAGRSLDGVTHDARPEVRSHA